MNKLLKSSHCRGSTSTSTVPRYSPHGEVGGMIRLASSAIVDVFVEGVAIEQGAVI